MGQEIQSQDDDNKEEQVDPPPSSADALIPAEDEEEKKEVWEVQYHIGELVDCQDEVKAWLNAEIIGLKEDKVYVHFSGWHQKYDEWIEWNSPRIQPQWKPGMKFRINNRIDVKDTYNKWLEANIVEVRETTIVVHYKGYTK